MPPRRLSYPLVVVLVQLFEYYLIIGTGSLISGRANLLTVRALRSSSGGHTLSAMIG